MDRVQKYAGRSLLSVILTAVVITVNHRYSLGPRAIVLGTALAVVPAALMWWFRRKASTVALAGYLLMNLWIVLGFGLYKGLWKGALRLYLGTLLASLSAVFPKPLIGNFWFESSGILTFAGSLFVLYYGYALLQARRDAKAGGSRPATARGRALLTTGSLLAIGVVIGAYVATVRDRWVPPSHGIVRIGVIVPLGGPYAILGNSFVKAVQMAQADLKGTKYRYELLIRDSGEDPRGAREVIRKVIEDDRVDAVVGGISLIGQVTGPYATAARIPHTCVCTVATIGDGGYNFTNIPSPEAEAVRWVQEAQRRGVKTVALLAQDYPSINNHVKAFKAEASRVGLGILYENRFAGSVSDFRATIAGAQATHPDIYYVEALSPALDRLAGQLADAQIRNIASVVAPSLSDRPELFEGVWYTDSDLATPGFKQRFEAQYPGTRFATHMMPYAYDSFNLIVQAYERGLNPAVYIRGLARYTGVAGLVTKAPGSGNFHSTPAVWLIKAGKPVLLK